MLQNIRDNSQGWITKTILGVIVVLMALTGFDQIIRATHHENVAAQVNGEDIGLPELQQAADMQRRQLMQRLGKDFDSSMLDDKLLKDSALKSLIERKLILQAAQNDKFAFSQQALDQLILSTPEFQVDGKFNADRFDQVIRQMGYDRMQFRRMFGEEMLIGQLRAGIAGTGFVTDDELNAFARLEKQTRDFATLTVKADPAAWAERLEATVLPTGSLRRAAGGAVTELPGFDEGAWWVQDLAASLPAKLIGDIRGKRVYDLCAAPGGKTAQLVAQGAEVTAVDRSAKRLERVRENLARLHLSAEVLATDAATWTPDQPADAVLLDAPCSATGAIRRHPDILRVKTPEDIAKLAKAQSRLLAHAVDLVKPGGTLIYCTCSIQPEEGEAQIDRILARDPRVGRLPIEPGELGGADAGDGNLAELINERGEVRSLPGMLGGLGGLGGIDGFFVARLRRLHD